MEERIRTAIYRYCNYQERCHSEVKNKLYELGATTPEVNQLMATLIEENLLNESRYADSFARGRFRLKGWGRVKIKMHLKQHQVSDYCIQSALKKIDASEYFDTAEKTYFKKARALQRSARPEVLKHKVMQYMLQKGFESQIIQEIARSWSESLSDLDHSSQP